MFSSKLQTLYRKEKQHLTPSKRRDNITYSENGAMKFMSTGNDFVDQFSKCGTYLSPRSYREIEQDCSILWEQDPLNLVKFIIYLRTITRRVKIKESSTNEVQRGTGLKHEAIMRMIWLQVNQPRVFWSNLPLFIAVGSWDDIFTMLRYDLIYQDSLNESERVNNLDWNSLGEFLIDGLRDPLSTDLIKKYLPQIRTTSACNTIEAQANNIIGKWFAKNHLDDMGLPNDQIFRLYRKFKSLGKAHVWQQKISQQKFDEIKFDLIPGRALKLMTDSKFLENQNLENDFTNWILSKPLAKFTGYPNELFKNVISKTKDYQKIILNKQFENLVQVARDGVDESTSMIVVRDTSGSMSCPASGIEQSCGDVAKSLALFFSHMLDKGTFANSWIEFNHSAKLHTWQGNTPYEKWTNDKSNYIGNTDFLSVINLFAQMKMSGVEESQFPNGIICISDCEFDESSLNETNLQTMYKLLRSALFSEEFISSFKVVLWNLQRIGGGETFETDDANTKNVFYFSGYDPSIIAFLTGKKIKKSDERSPANAHELFLKAMDQEILNLVKI